MTMIPVITTKTHYVQINLKKLLDFYQNNNFKVFGKRKLDGDETDLNGEYLVQLFAML